MRRNLKFFVLLIGVAVLGAGCSDDDNGPTGPVRRVQGSGNVVVEDRDVGQVRALSHAGIGDVFLAIGEDEGLRIEAEDNLLEHIITEMQGGTLVIRTEQRIQLDPTESIEFHLTCRRMTDIFLGGVGNIDAADISEAEVRVTLSGVGNIMFTDLDTDALEVVLLGVGDVLASGTAVMQTVTIGGVGHYRARDLAGTTVSVRITGVGTATVNASDLLEVTITGSGDVFYVGDPTIESTITGDGSVRPL